MTCGGAYCSVHALLGGSGSTLGSLQVKSAGCSSRWGARTQRALMSACALCVSACVAGRGVGDHRRSARLSAESGSVSVGLQDGASSQRPAANQRAASFTTRRWKKKKRDSPPGCSGTADAFTCRSYIWTSKVFRACLTPGWVFLKIKFVTLDFDYFFKVNDRYVN